MANTIIIKPSSGDPHAAIFAGPDATAGVVETVPKGTILKLTGSSKNFYEVAYDNTMENVAHGGSGTTGTLVAYPYAPLYKDTSKNVKIANVNNGTKITILDDTDPALFIIAAFTTEGNLEGYVESKYVYRDKVEEDIPEISTFSLTRAATPRGGGDVSTGTVTPSNGLKARSGPGTSYNQVGAFNSGATVTITETQSGWHKVSGSSGWGTLTDVWVSAQYVSVSGSESVRSVSKSDAVPASSPQVSTPVSSGGYTATSDGENWAEYFSNYTYTANNFNANDEYYRQLASKYTDSLGTPPKYNMDIDIQYMDEITAGGGRVMNKTVLSNPSILSICPGKVKMFPNLIGTERDTAYDTMLNLVSGNSSLKQKVEADEGSIFSGKLYKFEADTASYSLYLNALCRASALLLGIGEKTLPYTSEKLKSFDYSYWSIRKEYNPHAAYAADKDPSMFRKFWDGLLNIGDRVVSGAVDDTTYINFFLNGSETSISENISNSVRESPLAGALNTVSDASAMLNYFAGGGFNVGGEDAEKALEAVLGNGGETVNGLLNMGKNFLKGGRMVLPKMLDGASYSKSISCNMKFMSPYGDPYSVFLKCIVPICHILAMALPRQLSDNMYTFPFVVRCAQIGQFNVDLGVITGVTITRGGSDDTSWTINSLATEWDVTVEITPLVDELMITSTNNPVLLCKNENLLDYLGNFCGFDVLAHNPRTKWDMMTTFVTNSVLDWPRTIENKISDTLFNKIDRVFRYSL